MPGIYPTISSGSAFRYPITRSRSQRVGLHQFCDFSELRYVKGHDLTEFALKYNSITTADKETLRLFYAQQGGELATDWSLDFDGTTYTSCQFVGPFEAKCIGATTWSVTVKIRALPQAIVKAASLFLISSHTPGTPAQDMAAIASNAQIVSLVTHANWIQSGDPWSQRTDTLAIAPNSISNANVILSTWSLSGGLYGTPFNTPDLFLIYDCWMQVTLMDGTVLTRRPTHIDTQPGPGSISNPQNITDGDSGSFATITTTSAAVLTYGPGISLTNFQ